MALASFKRKQAITVPVLSFARQNVAYVKIIGEMHKSEFARGMDATAPDLTEKKREPATVARVIDLESGETKDMICPALLITSLEEKVKDYVGKCFEISVTPEVLEGKSYRGVTVYEIEDPASSQ